jgi:hypothetical protein
MNLVLFRPWKQSTYTIGKLFIEQTFICNTLEPPVRELKDLNDDGDFDDPNEGKIYGSTAIPQGKYRIILTWSSKFKRILPLLVDVKGFEGIRIHPGNSVADTAACILPGENKERGRVINSTYWTNFIMGKISEAINRSENVFITIYNE